MADRLADGATTASDEIARGRAALERAGFDKIDYLEIRDAETLEPVEAVTRPARVLAAVWLGKARLIDKRPGAPWRVVSGVACLRLPHHR